MNYLIGVDFIFRGVLALLLIYIANKLISGKPFKENITIANILTVTIASLTGVLNVNWIVSIITTFMAYKVGECIDNKIIVK